MRPKISIPRKTRTPTHLRLVGAVNYREKAVTRLVISGERATVENLERTSHPTVSFACQNDYESDFHFARVSRPICAAAALPPNRVSSGDSPFASASLTFAFLLHVSSAYHFTFA